jgi:hypothetical protein
MQRLLFLLLSAAVGDAIASVAMTAAWKQGVTSAIRCVLHEVKHTVCILADINTMMYVLPTGMRMYTVYRAC